MIVLKLGLHPGSKVAESGTGSGNLSVSMIKALFPKGHLYTFEFNEVRVQKAQQDFAQLGLDEYVTCTHRDVLAEGFFLDDKVTAGSMDACFLDLPSPERAVTHAYQVLSKKGKVCNFSPCIEQVQKVTEAMAKIGFYDIRTFEVLNHEIENKAFQYNSIFDKNNEEATDKDGPVFHEQANKKRIAKKKETIMNKRKMKSLSKQMAPVSSQQPLMRGHTGYLTFAIKF